MSGQRKYGLMGNVSEDETRCVEAIHGGGAWPSWHQCNFKRGHGKGGLYCKIHDPVVVAKRKTEKKARFEREMEKELKPYEEIKKLRAQIAEKDARIENLELSNENLKKTVGYWGLLLGYEPGRQINQMCYPALGDFRATEAPLIVSLKARVAAKDAALQLALNAFEKNWAIDWNEIEKALSSDGSEILKRLAEAKEPRGTGMHNVCQCCERLDALRESASRQEGEKE